MIAIGICLRVTSTKQFSEAYPDNLFHVDGRLNGVELDNLVAMDDEDMKKEQTSLYSSSIAGNRKVNASTARLVWLANAFLFISMFLVTLAVFYTLFPLLAPHLMV